MTQFLAIVKQTVRSYVTDRIFHSVLVFSVLLVFFASVLSSLTMVESAKVLVDFSLSAISLMGIFLGLFLGATLLGREIESRTVYAVLAKPVSRNLFLIAKLVGGACVISLVHVLCMLVLAGIVLLGAGALPPGLPATGLLMALESTLVMAAGVLFSLSLSSIYLSSCLTIALFLIGRSIGSLRLIQERMVDGIYKSLLRFVIDFGPSLDRFNIRELVAYGKPYPDDTLPMGLLYFLLYACFLAGLSCLIFRRKDLR